MTILDRYIIRFFIGFLLLSLSICLFIVLIIPFVEELDVMIANEVPFKVMVSYLLYSVPTVFVQVIPMVVLLALLLALIGLNRHQELLAMQANGISLYRLMFFLFLVVCGIAIFTWLVEENLSPVTLQQAKLIKTHQIHKKPLVPFLQEDQFWIRGEPHLLFSLGFVNRTGTQLHQVTILELSADETKIVRRLEATELHWNKHQGWIASSGLARRFNNSGDLVSESKVTELPVSFPMQPNELQQFSRNPAEFNTQQLKQYVELVRASGLDVKDYLVDYYLKYTNFISPIILALLGIAYGTVLAPRTSTKRFAVAILLAIAYYLLLFFMRNLGRSGVVPAGLSAFLVPLLYLGWSLWRIYRNSYS
ncbi:MAG: LptF/LptG family permease [bacterium]|nr:LptF/LptG family permease [bacterium]